MGTVKSKYLNLIIEMMALDNITMSEAVLRDMDANNVDTESVIGMVDYLEDNIQDLNMVQYFMQVLTGHTSDLTLIKA